ncbi:MAG TPA: alpha/beta hydrolase [Caulobacteraceae bacterium]|nr:alpha/beta hydrolase [Caulobacteraceae bacterium]
MGRGAWIVGLAALLAGCGVGGDRAPAGPTRTPPGLAQRFYPPEGWGWGLLQLGDAPAQRYGVSSPATAPRGQVLILPDYGETAETWFETTADLNAAGYTVWVLEGVGQGGSARLAGPRDLGQVRSLDPDADAVRAMVRVIIRPKQPLVILGQGVGAVTATLAVEQGLRPDGLILSGPAFRPYPAADTPLLRKLGLGATRVPGGAGWRREGPAASPDPWRGQVTRLWQTANPDLRMGAPSLDWIAAFNAGQKAAQRNLDAADVPILVIGGPGASGCGKAPRCEAVTLEQAKGPLELERDPVRAAWLAAVTGFIRDRLAPLPKPARGL